MQNQSLMGDTKHSRVDRVNGSDGSAAPSLGKDTSLSDPPLKGFIGSMPVLPTSTVGDIEAYLAHLMLIEPALDPVLDLNKVAADTLTCTVPSMSQREMSVLLAETAVYMSSSHPDYEFLAARIAIDSLNSRTPDRFTDAVKHLRAHVNMRTGRPVPLISDEVAEAVEAYGDVLDAAIVHRRNYAYKYFGFKTLERGYLMHDSGRIIERPQYMIMRVAVGIHRMDIKGVLRTYDLMSRQLYTHATPTLFNAGVPNGQLSSCFLLTIQEDSIVGIYDTLKQCALISKAAGGIGFAAHKIRSSGSYIAGTNGEANGLIPMLRVFNDTARYVDQCFVGETSIVTQEYGPIPIGRLYAMALEQQQQQQKQGQQKKGKEVAMTDAVGGATVLPVAGVHVLSHEGKWSVLNSVVCHQLSPASTGDAAGACVDEDGDDLVCVRSGSTLLPKFVSAPSRPRAEGGCTAFETRMTGKHQVMVLCDGLDNDVPVVVDRVQAFAQLNSTIDDFEGCTVDTAPAAAPAADLASAKEGDEEATQSRDENGEPNTEGEHEEDKEEDRMAIKRMSEADPKKQLCGLLYYMCELIEKGHVRARMVDADTLRPGNVLCHVIPPEPVMAPGESTQHMSDWRMAGIIAASIDGGHPQRDTPIADAHIVARVGGDTARFVATYIAVAEGRPIAPHGVPGATNKDGSRKERKWRVAHPALAKALQLATSGTEAMAHTSNVCLEAYVSGVFETLAKDRKTSPRMAERLMWVSLRLVPRAVARANPEAVRSGKPSVLSVRVGHRLPNDDGKTSGIPDAWSVVHGPHLLVPIEDVHVQSRCPSTTKDKEAKRGKRRNKGNNQEKDQVVDRVYDLEVDDPQHIYTTLGVGACHNGGGKRKGAFACYLEPWHADIFDWLELKKNHGKEENRARDLFYALWSCDLFMRRAIANQEWSLFCPSEAPGLFTKHGAEFEALYERYEREGLARRTVSAQQLWMAILDAQIETGTPYIMHKDSANATSNQKNLGTMELSNLCVAPETRVLTDRGHACIRDLAQQGEPVNVWNGTGWSRVQVVQTGTQRSLVTVTLSDGARLECTPSHKFIVAPDGQKQRSETNIADALRINASALVPGTQLIDWTLPVLPGDATVGVPHAYTHGFYCGAGQEGHSICLCHGALSLANRLDTVGERIVADNVMTVTLVPDMAPRFHVPLGDTSIESRIEWLSGLFDAATCQRHHDGSTGSEWSVTLDQRAFLDQVRLLLQTLGARSTLSALPNVGNDDATKWRLTVWPSDVPHLVSLGMRPLATHSASHSTKPWGVTVESVVDKGRVDDTYCFSEPINHAGIFEGVCTGQCTEVIQYASKDEASVCNLSSLALPKFVASVSGSDRARSDIAGTIVSSDGSLYFDHEALHEVTQVVTRNLNKVIDVNAYPLPETQLSNMLHRPMGIGVQGLADVFAMMELPWESEQARILNRDIFETIYHAALTASCQLAAEEGPYPSFRINGGSPASHGLLHMDLWAAAVNDERRWRGCDKIPLAPEHRHFDVEKHLSGRWDWDTLRASIREHGLRNSLLVAPMPTASTSQILGNVESIEVPTTNLFSRRVLAGDFPVVNHHLVRHLLKRGLWNESLRARLVAARGSVQDFTDDEMPADLRAVFKTAWEVPNKVTIDMAADRAPYIDQSQSLNLYCETPKIGVLTSMHAYAWRRGLKTGMYYLRTKPAANAIQFTVDLATTALTAPIQTYPLIGSEPVESVNVFPTMAVPVEVEPLDGDVCYPGCVSCSG